jgi:serine/threonine protein kinase
VLSVSSDAATAVPRYAPADSADAPTARVREPDLAVTPAPRGSLLELPDRFEGFEVLGELGRGAMGRVYLARQHTPTERLVVLKVGTHLSAECRKLSKLQHPHIVPVYSFHQNGRAQAVCMPYRGPLTLAHAVARLRAGNVHTLDGRALTTALDECRRSRAEIVSASAPVPLPQPTPEARRAPLGKLNYTDAVLTLFAQIADGLRAAHAEHIVHCDLKPANVLIADDGTAQLIDFGVALDTSDAVDRMRLGGTRPYMSPEQLESFEYGTLEHDERSDLYAVGVMLYEVLTGELPFEPLYDPSTECLVRDRKNRSAPFVPVRQRNPNVPPAVAALVAKCLAPRAADRYQSAAHLHEDLTRQLAREPLKHSPNPSARELVRKWGARNRVLLAAGLLLALAGSAVAGFAHRDALRQEREARAEARAAAEPFAADRDEAEFQFVLARTDAPARERAWDAARRALARYGALDRADWVAAGPLAALEPDHRREARARVAELMLVLAHDRAADALRTAAPAARAAKLSEAKAWADRAAAAHPDADNWRALLAHTAGAARAAGDPAEAERFERRAAALPRTAPDAALEARALLLDNRPRAALDALADGTRAEPGHYWCAFYTALAHQLLERYDDAAREYGACLLMRPHFGAAHYNRGLALFRGGRAAEAEADFDRALATRADWPDALFGRALAREFRGTPAHLKAARDDLSAALKAGAPAVPVLLARPA